MDLITLAMAKKYTDEKAGYVEKPVFTYDGKGEVVEFENGLTFHRITDKFHDLNTLVKMEGFAYGSKMEFTADDITVTGETDTSGTVQQGTVKYAGNDMVFILALKDLEGGATLNTGVYVFSMSEAYVSYVEFAETIHTIDPKFIPGAVLPVVELETEIVVGNQLTDADKAAVAEVLTMRSPVVLSAMLDGMQVQAIAGNVGGVMLAVDFFVGRYVISAEGITAMTEAS